MNFDECLRDYIGRRTAKVVLRQKGEGSNPSIRNDVAKKSISNKLVVIQYTLANACGTTFQ